MLNNLSLLVVPLHIQHCKLLNWLILYKASFTLVFKASWVIPGSTFRIMSCNDSHHLIDRRSKGQIFACGWLRTILLLAFRNCWNRVSLFQQATSPASFCPIRWERIDSFSSISQIHSPYIPLPFNYSPAHYLVQQSTDHTDLTFIFHSPSYLMAMMYLLLPTEGIIKIFSCSVQCLQAISVQFYPTFKEILNILKTISKKRPDNVCVSRELLFLFLSILLSYLHLISTLL